MYPSVLSAFLSCWNPNSFLAISLRRTSKRRIDGDVDDGEILGNPLSCEDLKSTLRVLGAIAEYPAARENKLLATAVLRCRGR